MTERSDPDWVRGIKSSDPQVLDELWINIFSWSVALAKRYHQDEHCAQDVAESAYFRVQRGIGGYAFRCPLLGWCRTIVVNAMKRRIVEGTRESKRNRPLDEIENQSISSSDFAQPESALHASDNVLRARLQPCLDILKAQEREVIELRYLHELTPQEVADRLDLNRNHVNVIAHRARQSLLDCLLQQGFANADEILSL